jgi:hypothetical protein
MLRPKIAVLVADSFGEPFESIKIEIQPRLWQPLSDVDVFYMRGRKPNLIQTGFNLFTDNLRYKKAWPIQRLVDQQQISLISRKKYTATLEKGDLNVNVPEGLRYLGLKLIQSLKYIYHHEYDVVYKTTLSSIVNPTVFQQISHQIDHSEPFYGGTPINFGTHPFVSGANLMMNRKTLEIVLNSLKKWNHGLLDDVAIGRLLEDKVSIHPIASINFSTLDDAKAWPLEDIKTTMHFRCKSSSVERDDVAIMIEALRRIQNDS